MSASNGATSTKDTQQNNHQTQLTSFGFLNEVDDQQESLFALGSIFSRVRNAFASQDVDDAVLSTERSSSSTDKSSNGATSLNAKSSTPNKPRESEGGTNRKASATHQRKTSTTYPSALTGKHPDKGVLADDVSALARTTTNTTLPTVHSTRSSAPSGKTGVPFSLSSSRQAPALTSTAAAHAVSRNRLQSLSTSDARSMAENDDEGEDGEDVLTSLMRRSGVDHTRASAGRYSSIPGFPLHKDTIGDDTRSVHSSSSRLPRSEINSTSEAQFIIAHSHAHQQRQSSRASLGTSAEAFRRMRGEGAVLSKNFWMPDENVKECRECQSYFTPFRRKHHCRICGLVYCSRCASNIVSGSRFGLDGSEVRVCNFCSRMLSEYERAGMRSNASVSTLLSPSKRVATTFARKRTDSTGFGTRPDKGMISGPLEAQLTHPQAQFAANQLFSYPRSGFSKSAIATTANSERPRITSLQDMLAELEDDFSRPQTPISESLQLIDDKVVDSHVDEPVPFRVKLSDEDGIPRGGDDDEIPFHKQTVEKDSSKVADKKIRTPLKAKVQGGITLKFPTTAVTTDETPSFIRTNRSREARTRLLGEPVHLDGRQRLVSDAALRAYRKSKLKVRESSTVEEEEGGKRTLQGLDPTSIFSKSSQLKRDASFIGSIVDSSNPSNELTPTSLSHIKRLLAQALKLSNVPIRSQWQKTLEPLLLSIVRNIHPNPKIGESMDIRQYIKIKRIAGGSVLDSSYVNGFVLSKQVATKKMSRSLPLLNPRVMVLTFPIDFHRAEGQFMSLESLLAQEHEYTRILVARILQLRPNIIVVKDTVSRLALDMLEDAGVVVVWSVKLSAVQAISRCCQADMISSIDRLALESRLGRCASFKVETFQHAHASSSRKSMMRFTTSGSARSLGCTIILRGSNLETLGKVKQVVSLLAFVAHHLRLEEQLNRNEGAQVNSISRDSPLPPPIDDTSKSCSGKECAKSEDDLKDQITDALLPFESTILSASASIIIPPPHSLVKMKDLHHQVQELLQQCSCEVINKEETISQYRRLDETNEKEDKTGEGPFLEKEKEKFSTTSTLEEAMPKPSEAQALYTRAMREHDLYLKEWKSSCANLDLSTSVHKLSVLWAFMSSATQKPCMGPQLLTFNFYGSNDESLGHYLERICTESGTICMAKGCGRPRGVHFSSFVHNETRVQVVQERFVCPIPGQENRLLMWSYCKVCEQATPVTPVSDDTWGFSFAKYLELHFYNVKKITTICGHDYYANFIRFFSLQNLAIRFHCDRDLTVREVIFPPLHLLPRPDVDYRMKVEEARSLQDTMDAYWSSVLERMAALRKEPHLSVQHVTQLDSSIEVAKTDESDLRQFLLQTCRDSDQTDILALNVVRNRLQAAVVRWDQFFQEFERIALPNERDVRRLTSHHLSRLFQEKSDHTQTPDRVVDALGLTPAAEVDEGPASGVENSLSTSTSDEASPALAALLSSAPGDAIPDDIISESDCTADQSIAAKSDEKDRLAPPQYGPTKASSPATWRHRRAANFRNEGDANATQEDSSSMETKGSSLVSQARPKIKRGKTAESAPHRAKEGQAKEGQAKEGQAKEGQAKEGQAKEGQAYDGRAKEGEGDVKVDHARKVNQPSTGPAGPGGRRNAATPRRGPPSSYRPPKSMLAAPSSSAETESDNGATSSSSAMLKHSIRRKSSLTPRRGRSTNGSEDVVGPSHARATNRIPVSVRPSNKVSTIARRFDLLHKEAEKERERQKQVMAVRARRARPVAASQATVQVYRNLKEAVRDDDESDSASSGEDGVEAEDEDEDETEIEEAGGGERGGTARIDRVSPRHKKTTMLDSNEDGEDAVKKEINLRRNATRKAGEASSDSESSPDRERGPLAAVEAAAVAAVEASHTSRSTMDGTHESAAAELTVSSLLSGTLPASWRASLLPEADGNDTRGSLLKTLTSLWGRGNAHLPMIELPMRSTEHLFTDSPLVVLREDEPSSLIAFTLNSSTYASRLKSLREKAMREGEKAGAPSDPSGEGQTEDTVLRAMLESDLRQQEGTHLSFQFSSGDSRFSIRVLFTEQFDAFRQACQCGQTFIQSLARCSNWVDCSGGKSGAVMMKTLDDRFVIKQLSRAEMDAFANNAGAYFRFLADVLFQDRPTTLAKIYGVYRLTIRNAQSGKYIKLDCAITEHVFANAGKMSQIYDLKGALRNRFVQPNGQPGQVLQDGNLVISKVPIFLHEASKRRLREALFHDSLFLANCEVMDYSLVLGIASDTAEIRVGIIDFIRTFTRGKKLESMFKEAVAGPNPTVVNPEHYRTRFLSFLDSVLLISPDHWLSKEEELHSSDAAALMSH
ncbi:hypothetical protein CBS101457_002753 [Exobasidium rhododendri]|nr:hypothetical protein CBS101457_002753 [Exobasidium rhododendri]